MANVQKELLNIVHPDEILCAIILNYDPDSSQYDVTEIDPDHKNWLMKIGDDVDEYILTLDFTYDSGYGGQEIFGTVWLKDGTWLERGEYDGSEWWEHKICPKIPQNLQQQTGE